MTLHVHVHVHRYGWPNRELGIQQRPSICVFNVRTCTPPCEIVNSRFTIQESVNWDFNFRLLLLFVIHSHLSLNHQGVRKVNSRFILIDNYEAESLLPALLPALRVLRV